MTTDAQIKIEAIDNYSPYLATVRKLWRANSKTLGNLPKGAFEERAKHRQILVALDSEAGCIGYLLYRRSYDWFTITHLCIDPVCRGKGVAKQLVDRLKQITTSSRGIKLSCRRDYNLQGMWSSFGFIACEDLEGRSKKKKTILTRWVLEHNPLPLFSKILEQQIESKLCVMIAPDIFFDLYKDENIDTEEPFFLLADWVQTELTLCINDEIFNQINKIEKTHERNSLRSFAETFPCLPCDNQKMEINQIVLQKFLNKYQVDFHEDNLRYLARSITSDSHLLLTKDDKLLELASRIHESFRLSVIHPDELINQLDELRHKPDYQPVRLSGTCLEQTRVKIGEEDFLLNYFQNSQRNEEKTDFQQHLRRFLAESDKFECVLVREGVNQPLALIVYGRQKKDELEILMLRVGNNKLSSTLAHHLVFKSICLSAREQRQFTRITDPYLEEAVITAIQEDAFVQVKNGWLKANLPVVKSFSELSEYLTHLVSPLGDEYNFLMVIAKNLEEHIIRDAQALVDIERFLFPAKISDSEIPTFIIPIQPIWAKDLFDEHLANQMLPFPEFGAKPELAFNREAVYYRSVKNSRGLNAPCRILWYVSETQGERKGKGFYDVGYIRACSYVDEVIIGKPKELYQRFQRLGVYKLSHVEKIPTDKNGDIMAIRFSDTELFKKPVSFQELHRILEQDKLLLACPYPIHESYFMKVYNLGIR
ncbi:N-acetyltransferase [Scytonema tolypothrichoides VB-61278]|nr:N-acetyltransferase [Scytonema tolypothrichoides VB-61278]